MWEYKDCRSSLKKVGWDMAQFSRMAKDAEAHFDFSSVGSMSRDYQGSRRKKGGSKRSSKKSGGRKREKESRDEVGFIAGGLPPGVEGHQVSVVTSVQL